MAGCAGIFAAGFVVFAGSVDISRSSGPPPDLGPSDGIVVLTGGVDRIRAGLQLFTASGARRILISGVDPTTTRAQLRDHYKIPPVISECCLDLGYSALNTTGNADEARRWATAWNFRRIIVVTSGFHMPRSMVEFRRALPDVELVRFPVAPNHGCQRPWWIEDQCLRYALREYVKLYPAMLRLAASRVTEAFAAHAATGTPALTSGRRLSP